MVCGGDQAMMFNAIHGGIPERECRIWDNEMNTLNTVGKRLPTSNLLKGATRPPHRKVACDRPSLYFVTVSALTVTLKWARPLEGDCDWRLL